jgi:hypothetical protein
MMRRTVVMSNGLITERGRVKGGAKLAATVALWLRKRYSLRRVLETEKGELHVESGIGHCSGIGTSFALECDAHRGGLAHATGKITEEDRMTKTISALTAAMFFAVCASAFAQTPSNEQAPAQMPAPTQEMTPPAQAPAQAPSMGEEKKAEKPAKGNQGKGKAKGHAKKTSKKGKDKTGQN